MSSEAKIKEIVTGIVHCDPKVLTTTASWKELKADSLDLVQILVALEETFSIEVADQDAEKLKTFGDLVSYVDGVLAQRAKAA